MVPMVPMVPVVPVVPVVHAVPVVIPQIVEQLRQLAAPRITLSRSSYDEKFRLHVVIIELHVELEHVGCVACICLIKTAYCADCKRRLITSDASIYLCKA